MRTDLAEPTGNAALVATAAHERPLANEASFLVVASNVI